MFSTFFSNYTFIYRGFSYISVKMFKVVCCRFVVCGKGLSFACKYIKVHISVTNKWWNRRVHCFTDSPCCHYHPQETIIMPFNPFPDIDTFWHLCSRQLFENMATKEEIAQNKQFLLLSPCFQLYLIIVLSFKGIFLCFCLDVFKKLNYWLEMKTWSKMWLLQMH